MAVNTVVRWATPVVVGIEALLVWTGRLGLGNAVWTLVAVEVLLASAVLATVWRAARRARRDMVPGASRWHVAEDALARVLPRRVAHVVAAEPRAWIAIVELARGRGPAGERFGYHGAIRVPLGVVIALLIVEGVVVEFVLAALLGNSGWVWLALGLHVYGVVFLFGLYASMVTLPHTVCGDTVHLRAGTGDDITVQLADVVAAVVGTYPKAARSWWVANPDGSATFAFGDANIELVLRDCASVSRNGRVMTPSPPAIHVGADDPTGFAARIRRGVAPSAPEPSVPSPGVRRPD